MYLLETKNRAIHTPEDDFWCMDYFGYAAVDGGNKEALL